MAGKKSMKSAEIYGSAVGLIANPEHLPASDPRTCRAIKKHSGRSSPPTDQTHQEVVHGICPSTTRSIERLPPAALNIPHTDSIPDALTHLLHWALIPMFTMECIQCSGTYSASPALRITSFAVAVSRPGCAAATLGSVQSADVCRAGKWRRGYVCGDATKNIVGGK